MEDENAETNESRCLSANAEGKVSVDRKREIDDSLSQDDMFATQSPTIVGCSPVKDLVVPDDCEIIPDSQSEEGEPIAASVEKENSHYGRKRKGDCNDEFEHRNRNKKSCGIESDGGTCNSVDSIPYTGDRNVQERKLDIPLKSISAVCAVEIAKEVKGVFDPSSTDENTQMDVEDTQLITPDDDKPNKSINSNSSNIESDINSPAKCMYPLVTESRISTSDESFIVPKEVLEKIDKDPKDKDDKNIVAGKKSLDASVICIDSDQDDITTPDVVSTARKSVEVIYVGSSTPVSSLSPLGTLKKIESESYFLTKDFGKIGKASNYEIQNSVDSESVVDSPSENLLRLSKSQKLKGISSDELSMENLNCSPSMKELVKDDDTISSEAECTMKTSSTLVISGNQPSGSIIGAEECITSRSETKDSNVQFSLKDREILTPECSTPIPESAYIFSKVKDIANLKPANDFLVPPSVDISKRKRNESPSDFFNMNSNDGLSLTNSEKKCKPTHNKGKEESEYLQVQQCTPEVMHENSKINSADHKLKETPESAEDHIVEVIRKVGVKLRFYETSNELVSYEFIQLEDYPDLLPRLESDSSSGALGDVSKSSSPSGSTTSTGPFPIPTRLSRISLTSLSSSSSSSSTGHQTLAGLKRKHLLENNPTYQKEIKENGVTSNTFNKTLSHQEFFYKSFEFFQNLCKNEKVTREISTILKTPKNNVEVKESSELVENNFKAPAVGIIDKKLSDVIENVECDKIHTVVEELENVQSNDIINCETPTSSKKRGGRTSKKSGRGSEYKTSETKDMASAGTGPKRRGRRALISTEIPDKVSQTPKTKRNQRETEMNSVNISSDDPNNGDNEQPLKSGCSVFARWTDKKYYSAVIRDRTKDGRWSINFDDGSTKILKEEFIVPVNILSKGQLVFALIEDGGMYEEEGIITKYEVKRNEVHYGVELNNGQTVFVPRNKLVLTEDHIKLLQEMSLAAASTPTTPKNLSKVDLGNLVEGKRPRNILYHPSVSGIERVFQTKPKGEMHDTSCNSSVSDNCDRYSSTDEVSGVEPESIDINIPETYTLNASKSKGPGKIKGRAKNYRKKSPPRNERIDEELDNELGPIPPEGSNLFTGKSFLLSCVVQERNYTDIDTTDDEDKTFSGIPFIKSRLKKQIEAGGGIVFSHFDDVPKESQSTCYLVANRPNQSAVYLLCLAHGITIISHSYIILKCKGQNVQMSYRQLPAGWSLKYKEFVNVPEPNTRARKSGVKPLVKKNIALFNENKHFLRFWERILQALGANVFLASPGEVPDLSKMDVIVSDSQCPPEIQERAREWNIPLLSSVWIKQCLINREFCHYKGHPEYKFDHSPFD